VAEHTTNRIDTEMQRHLDECIRLCLECARTCEKCGAECIRMEMAGMVRCIELCRDSADICLVDAQLMSRNSEYHFATCGVCADVCDACAAECDRMAAADEGATGDLLRRCAEICRQCGESCRRMAAMKAA
jgi:hypothetical protein